MTEKGGDKKNGAEQSGVFPNLSRESSLLDSNFSTCTGISMYTMQSRIVAHDCSAVCGLFGQNFGGWSGTSWIPLPPGGALIAQQGALLECKGCFSSDICGQIWLILRWRVGVVHSYLALNERATRAMGRCCPSACMILQHPKSTE